MPVDWMDVTSLSFNALLLLERVQLSWFPGWFPEAELATALRANPAVEWYLRHKCPQLRPWLDRILAEAGGVPEPGPERVRQAELAVMRQINDLLVYIVDPARYDAQPFLKWDDDELLGLADFCGKTVIDVGSGTGRLALTVAPMAAAVFAVEPVANLRAYLKDKARSQGLSNVYPVDGLIGDLPFPAAFADVTMGGHVFARDPDGDEREMARVTRPGGMVILCPGNNDVDEGWHGFLVSRGYQWSRFEEPGDGWKRKYWRSV